MVDESCRVRCVNVITEAGRDKTGADSSFGNFSVERYGGLGTGEETVLGV